MSLQKSRKKGSRHRKNLLPLSFAVLQQKHTFCLRSNPMTFKSFT